MSGGLLSRDTRPLACADPVPVCADSPVSVLLSGPVSRARICPVAVCSVEGGVLIVPARPSGITGVDVVCDGCSPVPLAGLDAAADALTLAASNLDSGVASVM